MADVEGKKLTELRVIDLKTELERRGLDKSGNKATLLERLSKVNFPFTRRSNFEPSMNNIVLYFVAILTLLISLVVHC